MKRPTKHLGDVDLRGRRRPRYIPYTPTLVKAKFLDGPLAGQTLKVERGQDYIEIGSWTYSYCGNATRTPHYAKLPKSRRDRKLLMFLIGKRGSDPRIEIAERKSTPLKRTSPPAAGRGARRRAERRTNVSS